MQASSSVSSSVSCELPVTFGGNTINMVWLGRAWAKIIKKNTKLDSKQTSNVPC